MECKDAISDESPILPRWHRHSRQWLGQSQIGGEKEARGDDPVHRNRCAKLIMFDCLFLCASAIGSQRTFVSSTGMSAFGGKADMTIASQNVR